MKRNVWNAIILGVAVLSLKGCIFSPKTVTTPPVRQPYAEPSAPESLIYNLQVSYRNREIDHYAQILAPEFLFQFQPVDQGTIGTQYWSRDQDSTGTRALLTTTQVSKITIDLTYSGRDTAINTPGTPLDSLKIRIITTDLQVDETSGVSWVVSDQQDMYFRSGKFENGEDPNHWWLYQWDDLPSLGGGAPGIRPMSSAEQPNVVSWGALLHDILKQQSTP